jgi:hypothetical protein
MVGGTKFPPQDSESGPWSHEQSNGKSNTKNKSNTKTFHERKNQNLSPVEVSLENADTVIEGAPLLAVFEKPDRSKQSASLRFLKAVNLFLGNSEFS